MPRIQPLEPENAPEQSRQLMEQGEQTMGQMLNFFKQMAVSPASFQAYMDFEEALQGGPRSVDPRSRLLRNLRLQRLHILTVGPLRRGGASGHEQRRDRAGAAV